MKSFQCDQCFKDLSSKWSLKRHLKIHTRKKPFKCDQSIFKGFNCYICTKAFSCKSHLTIHLRSHSGEKPFQCAKCGIVFSVLSNLYKHLRNRHLEQKPYQHLIIHNDGTATKQITSQSERLGSASSSQPDPSSFEILSRPRDVQCMDGVDVNQQGPFSTG